MPNTSRGYPYPSNSSPATVPADLEKLALAINGDVQTLSDTSTQNATDYDELATTVSGIKSIVSVRDDDGDGIATIHYTNGSSESIALPRGQRGPAGESAGPFVDLIDNGDGTATVVLYDGTERTLTLPAGPPGVDGEDGAPGVDGVDGVDGQDGAPGPANSLSIGSVTSGSAPSATITGTPPSQVLGLVLPKGEKGDPGDAGGLMDTGWRNIGLASSATQDDSVKVRRIGPEVRILLNGAAGSTGSGEPMLIWTTPTGFKPEFAGRRVIIDGISPKSMMVSKNYAISYNSPSSFTLHGEYTYTTSDPWPSVLPGTPG